jgi:uncharacterized protein (TIGR01244 family)
MRYAAATIVCVSCFAEPALVQAQQVTKPSVPGITNLARLETTVACAGTTKPEAVPAIKQMGFKTIINMREPTESGADIDVEAAAAKAAGITFVSIPMSPSSPDPAVADKFLQVITTPGNEPAYIHCSGGARAASMWLIKRLVVDRWDTDRAVAEATALGLTNARLKQFSLDYAAAHKR